MEAMTNTYRRTSLGALLLLLAQGCAGADKQPAPERQADANQQPAATDEGPDADAEGAPYHTIWTRPARAATGGAGTPRGRGLAFTRLALSKNSFAMMLAVENPLPNDPRAGEAEKPTMTLTVNGCPGPTLPVDGEVLFGAHASALTLLRAQLPKGDLEITVTAFDSQTTMLMANDDAGLRPITMQELRGYKRTPGDPEKGEPDTFTIEQPECP
jgi:hypothetical protein